MRENKTRRGISLLLIAIMVLFTTVLLNGCGKTDAKPVLNVLNYGAYIDKSLLDDFEKEFNCKVVYDTYNSPEDMYIKFKSGATNYDVIITGEYMVERLRTEGMLEKLDFSNIANAEFIEEEFKNQPYDPTNEYAVPYFWGTLGVLYNKETVDVSSNSWNVLWDDKYAGRVIMMDSQRDTFSVALKTLGYSLNTTDEKELDEALNLLLKQKKNVMAYVVDAAKDMMIGGEADLALVWSGEATGAMISEDGNTEFGFMIPKEGSNIWIDAMCIPKDAKNKTLGEKYIDFLTRTESTLKNVNEVMYSTVQADATSKLPEILKNNNAFNVDLETIKTLEMFRDLKDNIGLYNDRWTELMGTN